MNIKITVSGIRKLGTLRKAYNFLLPICQAMMMPGYEKTESDDAVLLLFNSISINHKRKKSPGIPPPTLLEALALAATVAESNGIELPN